MSGKSTVAPIEIREDTSDQSMALVRAIRLPNPIINHNGCSVRPLILLQIGRVSPRTLFIKLARACARQNFRIEPRLLQKGSWPREAFYLYSGIRNDRFGPYTNRAGDVVVV